jgi:hypothetical protein
MKKLIIAILSVLVVLSSFTVAYAAQGGAPGKPDNTKVEGVTLNLEEVTLTVTYSRVLEVTVYPGDAKNQGLIWKSSNRKIVTVTSDGTVTAVKPGEATITVTTIDGRYTDTCIVKALPNISGDWWLYFNGVTTPDAAFNDLVQDENGNVSGYYYNGTEWGGPVIGFVSGDSLYLYYERPSGYCGEFKGTIDSDGMTGTFKSFTTGFYGTWIAVRTTQLPF